MLSTVEVLVKELKQGLLAGDSARTIRVAGTQRPGGLDVRHQYAVPRRRDARVRLSTRLAASPQPAWWEVDRPATFGNTALSSETLRRGQARARRAGHRWVRYQAYVAPVRPADRPVSLDACPRSYPAFQDGVA